MGARLRLQRLHDLCYERPSHGSCDATSSTDCFQLSALPGGPYVGRSAQVGRNGAERRAQIFPPEQVSKIAPGISRIEAGYTIICNLVRHSMSPLNPCDSSGAINVALALTSGAAQAQSGPFLYVPNSGSSTLSIIDTSTNLVVSGAIPVSAGLGAAVSGDELLAYLTSFSGIVTPINTATNILGTPIPVGTTPLGVVITPDAKTVYVANFGSNNVTPINTATNTAGAPIPVGSNPTGLAVTPDGKTVYVANEVSNSVTPISTATNTAGTPIPTGHQGPFGVAVTPDGKTVYVGNVFDFTISVISTATNSVVATIPLAVEPFGLAVTPDGKTVYVATGSSTVTPIDIATNTLGTPIPVGPGPNGVAVSPDGKTVYVTNFNSGAVTPINTATNVAGTPIPVGTMPEIFPGICSNGNALLTSGRTFVARTSGALACTLASGPTGSPGPVFTGGTLQFAAAGITSALPVSLQAAGGTFDTSGNSATLSGTISGPGGLTKIGAGTLTLSGANSFSGGITISAGTLLGSSSSLGTGRILDNAALVFDQAANGSFGAQIVGSGSLTKQGAGALNLTATSLLAGPTTVAAGTLIVDGSIANSSVTVGSGATLGGGGTVGSVLAQSGGAVAPGVVTPFTALNVSGNVTFAAGSTFLVNINAAGQNDKLLASGSATLQGGTVNVLAATGAYTPSSRYTILTADGGVLGSFAGLTTTSNLTFLSPVLSYDAKDVFLGFAQTTPLPSLALTDNQLSTAAAIQALGLGSPIFNAVVTQNSAAGAQAAFDALSGEIHASAVTAAFEDQRLPRDAIFGRLSGSLETPLLGVGSTMTGAYAADLPSRGPALAPVAVQMYQPRLFGLWAQGFGDWGKTNGDHNAAKLTRDTGGFIIGADAERQLWSGDWRFGVAAGYTDDSLKVQARSSSGDYQSIFGALYGKASYGAIDLKAGAILASTNTHTSRSIIFPGFADAASSSYGGYCGARLRRTRLPPALPWDAVVLRAGPLRPHRELRALPARGRNAYRPEPLCGDGASRRRARRSGARL